ncbi:hypothetical protein K439DRAFT_179000 [Ramaria rubella]|nr:hypothetical protein K439DRAFT_179000 [Ramaria rubella]
MLLSDTHNGKIGQNLWLVAWKATPRTDDLRPNTAAIDVRPVIQIKAASNHYGECFSLLPDFSDFLKILLPMSIFLVRFLEWWNKRRAGINAYEDDNTHTSPIKRVPKLVEDWDLSDNEQET